MKLRFILLAGFCISICQHVYGQQGVWNKKQCAVVLTYDDAINIDLDNVIPALDSAQLKGTFYLIGSSGVVTNRIPEWRAAAKNGHELGNHSLNHPCGGSLPGRTFVNAENDLDKYTVARAVNEIRINNTLLKAIDGKDLRTFAYPCGDLKIGDNYFYPQLRADFAGARGVTSGLKTADKVNLDDINCVFVQNQTGDNLIAMVKQAQETHTLLVFLFHGVGGGHSINFPLNEHRKLIAYLKQNEKDIWIAPMVDVAMKIKSEQSVGSTK